MKKTALVLALLLAIFISTLAGIHVVKVAKANPWWLFNFTAAPDISLDSPLNKTYTGSVLLDFTVTASREWVPGTGEFWYDDSPELFQQLNSVDYYIDGSYQGSIVANSDLSSPFHYSASLTDLEEGSHCLMVETQSTGVSGGYIAGGVYEVPANSSFVTVYFSIVNPTSPTPSPTPIPYEEVNVQNASLYLALGGMVVFTVIIVCVGLGLMVYLIKRK